MTASLSPRGLVEIMRRRRTAYKDIFESPKGQIVLADLMDKCGWAKDQFNEEPLVTANLLGRRWVVLHIKAVIGATDEWFDKMSEDENLFKKEYPK